MLHAVKAGVHAGGHPCWLLQMYLYVPYALRVRPRDVTLFRQTQLQAQQQQQQQHPAGYMLNVVHLMLREHLGNGP